MVVSWISLISTQRIASNAPAYPPGAGALVRCSRKRPGVATGWGRAFWASFCVGRPAKPAGRLRPCKSPLWTPLKGIRRGPGDKGARALEAKRFSLFLIGVRTESRLPAAISCRRSVSARSEPGWVTVTLMGQKRVSRGSLDKLCSITNT